MLIKVTTIWHNKVAIPDKVLKRLQPEEPLLIQVPSEGIMEMDAGEARQRVCATSDRKFRDKHGGADYYLKYYEWKPTAKQEALF